MKFLIIIALMIVGIGFSACATHQGDGYYDRANKASEKSLQGLEKEWK